ncbi:type III secretion system effector protein [Pseudomonas sp. p1(2021b)]|uniref:M91 family zinc metallopeptidase n=1 Tax=Pseudomonas sp. p1(2021b) TaxID=2874628 RepID=UPI001CCD58F6|nr:M91 family zinc metallopeptidase [Pseudomonas sp. p1(2021b)]UBM23991.1 type III secretion system effector protein [Pseudomonas sp. p1(2021b)]
MHPNPSYFISGRVSGFQQWADTSTPGKTIHQLFEYRDDTLDIFLEQVWLDESKAPHKHHMVIQVLAPDARIDISAYDCHVLAVLGNQRFILAPTPRQTLIVNAPNGNTQVHVSNDVKTPMIIRTGAGSSRITTGGGITEVFTGTGDARITVGQGLAFLESGSDKSRIDGHILVDDPHTMGVYARNQAGDARFEHPLGAPFDTLASDNFELEGSDTFKQTVNNHLVFLRHTDCGQHLLTELARRARIRVTETRAATQFYPEDSDPNEADHHIRQDSRLEWVSGFPAERGNLAFNPTRSQSENLPLFDFYRCLCEAYNAFNGTTLPGEAAIRTLDRRTIRVARAQLQAIGLPTGIFFDLDQDMTTPQSDTNPAPFNENALRLELGVPLRTHY